MLFKHIKEVFSKHFSQIVFFSIVAVELFTIGILLKNLNSYEERFFAKFISPIYQDEVIFPSTGKYKYFYEPGPNSINKEYNEWTREIVTNTHNKDSLNERFDYEEQKEPETFRIIALGDSFTYGLFVNTQNNYPEQLEDILNGASCGGISKFEVINLGVAGYDIEYAIERFSRRGSKYNPDLVLWILEPGDFVYVEELLTPIINKYYTFFKQEGRKDVVLEEEGKVSLSSKLALQEYHRKFDKDYIVQRVFSELPKISEYYQKPLVLLYFQNDIRIESKTAEFPKEMLEKLQNFVKTRIDTYLFELPDLTKKDGYLPDSHPNSKGYTIIANYISKLLKENGLLSCQ